MIELLPDEQEIDHPFREEIVAAIRASLGTAGGADLLIIGRDCWDYYAAQVTARHQKETP